MHFYLPKKWWQTKSDYLSSRNFTCNDIIATWPLPSRKLRRSSLSHVFSLCIFSVHFQIEWPRSKLGVFGQWWTVVVGPARTQFCGRIAVVRRRINPPVDAILHGLDHSHSLRCAWLSSYPLRLHGRRRFRNIRALRSGGGDRRVVRRPGWREIGRFGRQRHSEAL